MQRLLWCAQKHWRQGHTLTLTRMAWLNPDDDEERFLADWRERLAQPARPEAMHDINPVDSMRAELNNDLLQALQGKIKPAPGSPKPHDEFEALTEERQAAHMYEIVARQYATELKNRSFYSRWRKKDRDFINEKVKMIFGEGMLEPKKNAVAQEVMNSLNVAQRAEVQNYLRTGFTPPIQQRFNTTAPGDVIDLLMSATTAQLEQLRDNVALAGVHIFAKEQPIRNAGAAPAIRHNPRPFDRLLQLSQLEFRGEYDVMTPAIHNYERVPKFAETLKNTTETKKIYSLLVQLAGPDPFYAPAVDEKDTHQKLMATRDRGLKTALAVFVERYLRQHPDPADPTKPDPTAIAEMEKRLQGILEGQEADGGYNAPETLYKKELEDGVAAIEKAYTELAEKYARAEEIRKKIDTELPTKQRQLATAQTNKALYQAQIPGLTAAITPVPGRANDPQAAAKLIQIQTELTKNQETEDRLRTEIDDLNGQKAPITAGITTAEDSLLAKVSNFSARIALHGGIPAPTPVGTTTKDDYSKLRGVVTDISAVMALVDRRSTEASLFGTPAVAAAPGIAATPATSPSPNHIQKAVKKLSAATFTAAIAEIGNFTQQKFQKRKSMSLDKLLLALNAQEIEANPDTKKLTQQKKDRLALGTMLFQHRAADEINDLEKIVNRKSAEYVAGKTKDEERHSFKTQEDGGVFSGQRALHYLCGLDAGGSPKNRLLVFRDVPLHISQGELEALLEKDNKPHMTSYAYELAAKLTVLLSGNAKGRILRQDAVAMGNFIKKIYKARDTVWERRFFKEITETHGSKATLITQRLGSQWEAKHAEELAVKAMMASDPHHEWAKDFGFAALKKKYFDNYRNARIALKLEGKSGAAVTKALQEQGFGTADEKLWLSRLLKNAGDATKQGGKKVFGTAGSGLWRGGKWVARGPGKILRTGAIWLLAGYALGKANPQQLKQHPQTAKALALGLLPDTGVRGYFKKWLAKDGHATPHAPQLPAHPDPAHGTPPQLPAHGAGGAHDAGHGDASHGAGHAPEHADADHDAGDGHDAAHNGGGGHAPAAGHGTGGHGGGGHGGGHP